MSAAAHPTPCPVPTLWWPAASASGILCEFTHCCVFQELALKLRAEGRSYDPKVFKKKKQQKDGGKHPKAKVKIKSSQRNKAPYNVSCWSPSEADLSQLSCVEQELGVQS